MLKINYVFREMKQADILKAYYIVWRTNEGITSSSCSNGGSQERKTGYPILVLKRHRLAVDLGGENPVLKIGLVFVDVAKHLVLLF